MRRGWLVALLTAWLLVALAGPSAARASASPDAPSHGPVLVIGVPDLRWQDLDPVRTPTLWALAGRSSIGAMTDQSGEGDTRRATGWVVVGTGTRAVSGVKSYTVPDPGDPAQLAALRRANANARYHAQVGALGDALHRAGRTVAAVGPGAVLGGMTGRGTIDHAEPSLHGPLPRADVVLLELPQIYEVGREADLPSASALLSVDKEVASALDQMPSGGSVLVAGVSDGAEGGAPLHVAMASGSGFGPGRLTSPSTGRAGVVQLIDVAPTVLWLVGAPAPTGMAGVHWQSVAEARTPLAAQVASLIELDERSRAVVQMSGPYAQAVLVVAVLYLLVTLRSWTRGRTGPPLVLSAIVATVPVGSWLTQLVPWWRLGQWTVLPLGALFTVIVGVAAARSPWPRDPRWRIAGVVGAVTAAVIVLDAATGSPLSLDAPFGDNPIIAGRFHGIGNVAFALLGSGALLLAAVLVAGRSGPRAAATVLGLGAVAVFVDGYPGLGDDFGGVLALLPAVAAFALLVSGVRVSWRYAVGIPAATVVIAAVFAFLDYARPAADRTHLGRFVQQVVEGTAWDVMHRKLGSSLHTFAAGWPRWITLAWLVLVVVAVLRTRRGQLSVGPDVDLRTTRALCIALTVLAVLGAGLNDSGLAVTAFVLAVAVPLLVPQIEPTAETGERREEVPNEVTAGPRT